MAVELVGGALISASLQALLERINSPVVMGYLRSKLRHTKGSELLELFRRLRTSARSVTAVLEDAEQKRMRKVCGVEEWLDELQETLFDADDLLDDIQTLALRHKAEAEPRSSFGARARSLYMRKKCNGPFSRSILARKIEKILARMEVVASKKELLGLKHVAERPMSQRIPSTSLVEESEIYGRDEDRDDVIKLLLSSDLNGVVGVIPIVGMGGLGKTTLAQLVYNDKKVREFEFKAWVCVSDKTDVCRVTKTILEAATSVSCEITDLNLLQVRLKEVLKEKKFLIVMDDVWNENYDDWLTISRPFRGGAPGSKIIVTTRSEKVAKIVTTGRVCHLKELLHENCLKLFAKHAFDNGDFSNHPELEVVGCEVVRKCKGLPLAVKTLGGLLRSTKSVGDWERIMKSEIWDLSDEESNIIPALRLSYHYLPPYLKQCFAYCSSFPKAFEFEKEQMVLLWTAENLIPSSSNTKIEDAGENCFDELVSRSFFQRSSTRGSFSLSYTLSDHFVLTQGETSRGEFVFVMHDLLRDLANYVSTEYCLHLDDERLSGEIDGKKARRLTYVASEDDPYKRFNHVLEATNLRVFLPIQNCESLNCNGISLRLVHDWLLKLECLRVLYLSGYTVSELPSSIGKLKHLRYLDLSHTCIVGLPKSVCELLNLQTLKLNSCRELKKLPKKMHRLVNMRYLDVRFCDNLVEMPLQVSKMKNLQMLSTFIVGKDSGTKIGELREHLDLRGELCIKKLENAVYAKEATVDHPKLNEKKYIESLAFEWSDHGDNDSTQSVNVLDMLSPCRTLKKLIIKNYAGTRFSNWFGGNSCENIVFLELYKCLHCKSLPPLGQLASLKTLIISEFDAVVSVGLEIYGQGSGLKPPFSSLETLNFRSMPSWEQWVQAEGVGSFAKLKELEISDCEKLVGNLPLFLPSLTELNISGCKKINSSLPRMPAINDLRIGDCEDQLQVESIFEALKQMEICPKRLRISNCSSSIPSEKVPTILESLDVSKCKSLEFPINHIHKSLEVFFLQHSCESLQSFPLDHFPKLNKLAIEGSKGLESLYFSEGQSIDMTSLSFLHITDCPNLTSFPKGGLRASNLYFLQIEDCVRLNSLPEKMRDLLPSLELLEIVNCPEIDSFPEGGLPRNLSSLIIIKCDKIIASRHSWDLRRLTKLTSLTIRGTDECEDLKIFPDEGLLPSSIIELALCRFPGLVELDKNGLQQLSFLKEMYILNCPKLSKIPKEALPASLEYFEIDKCPRLEKKFHRKKGKYRTMTDHIRCIRIGDEIVS